MPVDPAVTEALDAVAAGAAGRDVESETLDFKTVGRSIDDTMTDLAQAAACFANGRGGSIVVGVKDATGGPDAFVGCSLDAATTRRRIFERTEPSLTVDVEWLSRPEGDLLVIGVPEGAMVHSVRGRHTERVGTSCMPMSAARIAQVVADRSGDDWSDHATDLTVSDLDPVAMVVARRYLEGSVDPTRQGWARLADADLLRVLGVVDTSGRLNRAGALLLAPSGDRREVLAYVHRRTPTGSLTANESFTAPLLVALDRLFDLVSASSDASGGSVATNRVR